jgi:dephospho-CoA kinase
MTGFVVAITGGVGSGKTAAATCFERLGIVVVDADLAAREVVAPGQPALAAIVARFGADILLADGTLDRSRLRQRVFADANARRDLEAITHPGIRERLRQRCAAASGAYAVAAIPLLAEGGGRKNYPWLQRVLVVDAPLSLQRVRLMARDGIDPALAERMIAAQATPGQRLALADDAIVNDGTLAGLEAAVARLDRRYRELAAASPATGP